jgi:hypothetical protein
MKVGGQKTTDSKVTFLRDPATGLITQYVFLLLYPSPLPFLSLTFPPPRPLRSHEEEWTGDKNSSSEDGFLGTIQEMRKKFSAKAVNAFVDSTPYDQQK